MTEPSVMRQRVPRRKWIALGVSLAIVVGGAALYWHASRPLPFDPAVWLAGELAKEDDPPRLRMADGLVETRALLGKSRAEVEAMLGSPTETSKFRNYDLVYWLGPERGLMRIDSEWLALRLDSGARVATAEIVRD